MNRQIISQFIIFSTISLNLFAAEVKDGLIKSLEGLNPENCVAKMDNISDMLERLTAPDIKRDIEVSGHKTILQDLWLSKIEAHEKLREFHQDSGLFKDCADASRDAFKHIRTLEDVVIEDYYRLNKDSIKFSDNAFESGNAMVKKHPQYSQFEMSKDLKSGDIILSRGNAYTSAAIANLGEFDTQFSHMSLVYKDPAGKFWTVEAHIEVGSFVRPLEDHIEDRNFRSMVFRHDDSELAAKAAEYIFKKVKTASENVGNILYDFGFNQDDSKQLFCSEIVSHAFEHASQGGMQLPIFRSQLLTRKPEFVKNLGIKAETSFIPADIEIDPRFKVIAEFRNSAKINDSMEKDAIMQAVYKWNDELGYQMKQGSSKNSLIYRNIAYPLRRIPYFKKYVINKMPLNMSRALIGYFGVIESMGELLQDKLIAADDKAIAERGLPLLSIEKYDVLEAFRQEDLAARKKKLHKMYRPKKG